VDNNEVEEDELDDDDVGFVDFVLR